MNQTTHTFTGFLNIYKEAGFTSHDVVAKLRGILHQKKIGHLGTLDPNAEGVLPVALGRATKAISLLEDHTKAYDATLLLGTETDTYDIWGETLFKKQIEASEDDIRQVIASFQGDILQVPPMYSAKKQQGKRLYELAREGKSVERKAVPIHIAQIRVLKFELPHVKLHIECSKGTYIRSLMHDIGEQLGCGGCMETLLRTRAGQFSIEQAHRLSEIEAWANDGGLKDGLFLLPIDRAFSNLPMAICKPEAEKRAVNGSALLMEDIARVYHNGNMLYDELKNENNIDFSREIDEKLDLGIVNQQDFSGVLLNEESSKITKMITKSAKNSENTAENIDASNETEKSSFLRIYLDQNNFLGIYEWSGIKFYPRKVFI